MRRTHDSLMAGDLVTPVERTSLRFIVMRSMAFLACFFIIVSTHAEGASRLTVGLILPLSGDLALLGNGIRNAAILAKEDIERGGFSVKLLFADNQGDLATSATAARQLIAQEKVDALISIISGVGSILKPIADKSKILNIAICSDTEVADGRYSFIHYLSAEQGAAGYIDYFISKVGRGKSIGMYVMNEAGFRKIAGEMSKQAKKAVQIRFTEHFDRGITDFKPLLLRNRAQKPDAVLILGLSPEIELLARQSRALGMNEPLTSIESFGLSNNKDVFEGSWFVDSALPHGMFQKRYQRVYGTEVTPGVGHAYDTMLLLAKAFGYQRSSEPIDRSTAVQYFRIISEFPGVTGLLHVRPHGVIWSSASIKRIEKGEAVPVGAPDAVLGLQ